eukprot:1148190-Pelagomonas_calceolata.AAC.1
MSEGCGGACRQKRKTILQSCRLVTHDAKRQQLKITSLPQTVTFVRLMMMSRMNNMSSFIAHITRSMQCLGRNR